MSYSHTQGVLHEGHLETPTSSIPLTHGVNKVVREAEKLTFDGAEGDELKEWRSITSLNMSLTF